MPPATAALVSLAFNSTLAADPMKIGVIADASAAGGAWLPKAARALSGGEQPMLAIARWRSRGR